MDQPLLPKPYRQPSNRRIFAGFWLLEVCLVIQFAVVVTAANDLVGDKSPTGVVIFSYCIPSLFARLAVSLWGCPEVNLPALRARLTFWRKRFTRMEAASVPIFGRSGNEIDYGARLILCAVFSMIGLQLLAWTENIYVRMVGIMIISLSSNIGDMSMLMLCSRFGHASRFAFGGYNAGSGTSGLLGSFSYTLATTQLGIDPRRVLSFVSLAPVVANFGYHFLLPNPHAKSLPSPSLQSQPLGHGILELPLRFKLRIYRALSVPFMVPIAANFFLDSVLTQGILPTLLFSLPLSSPLLSPFFHTPRDFYRVYITISLFFSFLGRVSINFSPIRPVESPRSLMLFLVIIAIELCCLVMQSAESLSLGQWGKGSELYSIWGVLSFIALQGCLTGLIFCNVYWDVGKRELPSSVYNAAIEGQAFLSAMRAGEPGEEPGIEVAKGRATDEESTRLVSDQALEGDAAWDEKKEVQLREFALSAIAPADILSMLAGGVVAMMVQLWVCKAREVGRCTSGM